MTGFTLLVDSGDTVGGAPLVPPGGMFATAMRHLTERDGAAAVPDRVLLELYAYEIVERLRERQVQDELTGVVRIPIWPEAALAAADVEAHAARELCAMWPSHLRVVRRAPEAAGIERAMLALFGTAPFDPLQYCAAALADDPRDEVQRVAGVFLVRGDSVLLERRRADAAAYAGLTDTPGGKLEPGEDPAAAIARECVEELGIAVRDLRPIAVVDEPDPTSGAAFRHHVFATRTWDGEPEPREGQDLVWVPWRSLGADRTVSPQLALLADVL